VLLASHWLLLRERTQSALKLFAFSLAVIICTHVITTYLCALAVVIMALSYLKNIRWEGIGYLSLAGAMALALTAFS
jgi:hypothetical protein